MHGPPLEPKGRPTGGPALFSWPENVQIVMYELIFFVHWRRRSERWEAPRGQEISTRCCTSVLSPLQLLLAVVVHVEK